MFYTGFLSILFCLIIHARRIVNLKGGSIVIDGHNIRDIGLDVLRSRIALVPQDSTLFLGTLRENLYVISLFVRI